MLFRDRTDAGKQLAKALARYRGQNVVVYALPRGGVVLGAEIARELNAPLDLIVVRKIGHPRFPEYAIAAVATDGHTVMNRSEVDSIDQEWFDERSQIEQQEACRRQDVYRQGLTGVSATNKIAVIVDDGLATGLTMLAAVQELRHMDPKKVVVAVPVAPPNAVEELKGVVDDVVVLHVTPVFGAIGAFYSSFDQVTDQEVIDLMRSVPVTGRHG